MSITIVDKLYSEYRDIAEILDRQGEISLKTVVDENFRKSLLLCAASYFEYRVTTDVVQFCQEISGSNLLVPSLVRNKAVSRQYHTWFEWERSNANSFFGLFGSEFKAHMSDIVKVEATVVTAIKDFLGIGLARNRLVHQNYGTFSLEKTSNEIFQEYKSGLLFVERLPIELRACSARMT
jgi:hypothetical protein